MEKYYSKIFIRKDGSEIKLFLKKKTNSNI